MARASAAPAAHWDTNQVEKVRRLWVAPPDETFRASLGAVEAERSIGWVDATSASDPASACTLHALHGVLDAPDPERPLRRAPRFHKLLTEEHFRAIRRDPLAFHFQYLKATDLPGAYDWFAIAAGPDFLTERSPA